MLLGSSWTLLLSLQLHFVTANLDLAKIIDKVTYEALRHSELTFHVRVMHSANQTWSTQWQRQPFLKLATKWPIEYFNEELYPNEITFGNHSRCGFHILLLSARAVERAMQWVSVVSTTLNSCR